MIVAVAEAARRDPRSCTCIVRVESGALVCRTLRRRDATTSEDKRCDASVPHGPDPRLVVGAPASALCT